MECLQLVKFMPIIRLFFQWLKTPLNQSSAATLRNDLMAISNNDFQWKLIFNPDLTKQAQEVMFSRKIKKLLYPSFSFNDIPLKNNIS